jgi:hypothetical protein
MFQAQLHLKSHTPFSTSTQFRKSANTCRKDSFLFSLRQLRTSRHGSQITVQQVIPPVSRARQDVVETIIVRTVVTPLFSRHMAVRSQDSHGYHVQDLHLQTLLLVPGCNRGLCCERSGESESVELNNHREKHTYTRIARLTVVVVAVKEIP